MIGRSLRERNSLNALAAERAVIVAGEALASHGKAIVAVRARGERMIACVVMRADAAGVGLCKALGFRVKRGASIVFGLEGADAARLFVKSAGLAAERAAWLASPCAAREAKLLIVAGGIALASVVAAGGRVAIDAGP